MALVAGAIFVLFALLSWNSPGSALGQKRMQNTLFGALAVGAVVLVLARAGLAWVGLGVALLWSAARRFADHGSRDSAPRRSPENATSPVVRPPMTREEAFSVLGLPMNAPQERILAEYRRLMKKVHPDQGGTTYLAARLNEAKELLLGDPAARP